MRLGIQQTPWVDFEETRVSLPLPGHDLRRARRLPELLGCGRLVPHGVSRKLRGRARRHLQRGDVLEAGGQRPEGHSDSRHGPPATASAKRCADLRLTAFYDADSYVRDGDRKRFIAAATFEHKYANAAAQYLDTKDRTSVTLRRGGGRRVSVWVTPKFTHGFEGLLRYDDMQPNEDVDGHRRRTIAGLAYWLPHQGNVSSAVLLDYEQVKADGFLPAQPQQKRVALHALVNF